MRKIERNIYLKYALKGIFRGILISLCMWQMYAIWLDFQAERDLHEYHQMLTTTQSSSVESVNNAEVSTPTIVEQNTEQPSIIMTEGDTHTFDHATELNVVKGSAGLSDNVLITYQAGCAELICDNQRIPVYILADPRKDLFPGEYITRWTIKTKQKLMDNNSERKIRLYHSRSVSYTSDTMIIQNDYSGWMPTGGSNPREAYLTKIVETVEVKLPSVDKVDISSSAPLLPSSLVEDFCNDGYICVVRPDIVYKQEKSGDDTSRILLGYMDKQNKAIVLRHAYTAERDTLYHEMGHYLDTRYTSLYGANASKLEEFISIYEEEKTNASSYARTSSTEYFAASYAKYVMTPDDLRKLCPLTFAFFEETVISVL